MPRIPALNRFRSRLPPLMRRGGNARNGAAAELTRREVATRLGVEKRPCGVWGTGGFCIPYGVAEASCTAPRRWSAMSAVGRIEAGSARRGLGGAGIRALCRGQELPGGGRRSSRAARNSARALSTVCDGWRPDCAGPR